MYSLRNKDNKQIADNIPDMTTALILANGHKDCCILSDGGIVKEISSREIEKRYIDDLVLAGYEINIGLLSINKYECFITKIVKYQVSSSYKKHEVFHKYEKTKLPFSELYNTLEEAVDKFLELKKQCKL